MCIEIAINNVSSQGNSMRIKLNSKVEKIYRYCSLTFSEINGNAAGFCLVSSETNLPSKTPNMECFAKIVNG